MHEGESVVGLNWGAQADRHSVIVHRLHEATEH